MDAEKVEIEGGKQNKRRDVAFTDLISPELHELSGEGWRFGG